MMNEEYIKRLDFDSETFEQMKTDMNFILQRMLGSMVEKGSTEGSMTVKIDLTMVQEWIPNTDPDVEGETRMIRKPQFKHKCTSSIKISDEKSGTFNNEMELDMDENGCYFLKPVADTTQRTIFDKDFQSGLDKPEDGTIIDVDENGVREIPASDYPALPCGDIEGEEQTGGTEQNTGENAPDGSNQGENTEDNISSEESENNAEIDATEALFGTDETEEKKPDDYGYDEPEG